MTTYKKTLHYDSKKAFDEIRQIQGDSEIISINKIFDGVESSPGTYTELEHIIGSVAASSAKYHLSMTLRKFGAERWNNSSGSTANAVWRVALHV